MNKSIILAAFLAAVSLIASGCAKSSDVEALGERVTVLEGKVSALENDMAGVKAAAADASAKAAAAETAANRAAETAEQTNNMLNKMLK